MNAMGFTGVSTAQCRDIDRCAGPTDGRAGRAGVLSGDNSLAPAANAEKVWLP
jgi:hypothetical protein